MANQAHVKNERGPRLKQRLRDICKSKYLSPTEKFMLWLGWVPASIVRYIDCVWCGKEFVFSGEATADPPRYCTATHRDAAKKARVKRLAELNVAVPVKQKPAPVEPPKPPAVESNPKCRCYGHTGKPKMKYRTNASATNGLVRRHLKYGPGAIYQCPNSSYWHITTQMERNAS